MSKPSHQLPAGLLQPLPITQRPWSYIAIDFITDLPLSRGSTTILTVIDHFSKACRMIPLPKLPTALETAESLGNHVFRFYGLPEDIVSDQGPQFTSHVWSAFCRTLNINVSLKLGYHPQANGQELLSKSSPVSSALIVIGIRPTGVAISFGPNMLRTPSVNQPQVSHPSNVYWVSNLTYSPGRGNLQICLPSTPGSNRVRGPGMRLMSISNGQSGELRSRLIVDDVPTPTTNRANGSGCLPVINVFGCPAGNSVLGTWVPSKFSGK